MFRHIAIATVLGGLALSATSARAGYKIYPSYMCQEDGAGESGAFERNEAAITRLSAAGKGRLVCPVVRDTVSALSVSGSVAVTDWHPSGDVKCALSIRKYNGAPVLWKTAQTSGMQAGEQFLNIGSMNADGWLPLSVECTMPVNTGGYYTRIHHYAVQS
jgi:hypothetical protein